MTNSFTIKQVNDLLSILCTAIIDKTQDEAIAYINSHADIYPEQIRDHFTALLSNVEFNNTLSL